MSDREDPCNMQVCARLLSKAESDFACSKIVVKKYVNMVIYVSYYVDNSRCSIAKPSERTAIATLYEFET